MGIEEAAQIHITGLIHSNNRHVQCTQSRILLSKLGVGLVWFGVDYGLWINDPLLEIFSGPLPSVCKPSVCKRTGEVNNHYIGQGRAQNQNDHIDCLNNMY